MTVKEIIDDCEYTELSKAEALLIMFTRCPTEDQILTYSLIYKYSKNSGIFQGQKVAPATSRRDFFRLLGICSLLSFSVNFEYSFSSTYTNSAVDSFKEYINVSYQRKGINISEQEYSLLWNVIVNVWFIGFFVGIWLSRWLTDRFGRKPAFLIGNGFNVIGAVLLYLAIVFYEPSLLLVGRLICSTATSISYCSLILYLQEVPPSSRRGSTSCLNGCIYSIISIFGITLGNDELLGKDLGYYLGFAIVPCQFPPSSQIGSGVLSFLALFFLPETPKFLVSRGKIEKAEESVAFYHGSSADIEETVKLIQHDVDDAAHQKISVLDLVRERHLRNALWLALAALQNSAALWSILLSSTYYLENSGIDHHISQWSSTVMAVAYFAGTTTGVFCIDKFGRRPMLIWSNIANMSSLIFYTLFAELDPYFPGLKYGCLPMLALFGYSFGAGVGPVARFIGAELAPLKYRSLMTAVTFSENTIVNVITAFSCRPLFNLIGPSAFIIIYVVPSIFCILYIWKYLPETKGRETREVVEILRNQ